MRIVRAGMKYKTFWDAVSGIMSRDGWTSHATYDQAIAICSQIQAETAPHASHNVS
ncbi:hypothetical protein BO86DRAFT_390027 [Aspergillus japonicus CBS 114.51]|uniref:Uncharacterized protein n=1 Tax=Aspergillus japonicus CBS 114.51 TaxID=1448312 RepID=A0A8T8WYE3_ASPJA|nr:hypothetical protein BO86DRAFT_390027 [Aspergillus japonicus CBS 114.51]RAH80858.1 hypothetical protein BO86DRAFT_390027 [Aspergillus japonicus CBS 114.51]